MNSFFDKLDVDLKNVVRIDATIIISKIVPEFTLPIFDKISSFPRFYRSAP